MRALFADLSEATDNTLVIAQRCAFMPTESAPILPAFDAGVDEGEELRRLARDGLEARLTEHVFPQRRRQGGCESPIATGSNTSSASSSI